MCIKTTLETLLNVCEILGNVESKQSNWKFRENGHHFEISGAVKDEGGFFLENYNFSGAKFLCKSHMVECTWTNSISSHFN